MLANVSGLVLCDAHLKIWHLRRNDKHITSPIAHRVKDDIAIKAAVIGITPDYISTLVDSFYGHIRSHDTLGPIFEQAIGDNWDHHLTQMKAFWTSVALGSGVYSGKPVPANHKHRETIQSHHFDMWLSLFRQSLEETAPTSEAIDYFMVPANRIAKSLKLALFGVPGLGAPKYEE